MHSVANVCLKCRVLYFRHPFATLALQNGVDIKTVSGMLGHFSAGFTLDTYAHVTPEDVIHRRRETVENSGFPDS